MGDLGHCVFALELLGPSPDPHRGLASQAAPASQRMLGSFASCAAPPQRGIRTPAFFCNLRHGFEQQLELPIPLPELNEAAK